MLAELGWRNSALALRVDEHTPFIEVQQPAQQRLRHGGGKTIKMIMDNGRESVEMTQRQ
jgi:DNA-binding IclR family transcriptional regulator